MKKLMIAAAIVCATAMSYGASLTWKWTGTIADTPNGGTGYAGDVYLFNANQLGGQDGLTKVTQQVILDAFVKGTELSSFTSIDSYTTSDGKAPTTAITVGDGPSYEPVRAGTGADAGKNFVDFFYALVTTDENGKDYIFLSDTYNTLRQTASNTSLSKALSTPSGKTVEGTTFTSGGWYSAVPEPTSGLLLLLGVAGLALRRRRA